MNQFTPTVSVNPTIAQVAFSEEPHLRSAPFECVLDLTRDGSLVGIEILDFRRQLGGATLEPKKISADFRWSYDSEIDALYLHLSRAPAPIQKKSVGTAYVDELGEVTRIEVKL